MNRREILKTGLGSLVAASAGWPMLGPARAADWPTKSIRVVVPYAAGSATDLVPRTVFEQVGQQVGQSFIVENRPGGGTTIGSAQVKAADPDGHTILVHSNAIVTVPAIQLNVPYDPVKDFSGLTPLGNVPLVLVVSPSKGMKTLKELIDKAKAKPGEINYGAAGIGTPPHLAMERFRLAAGFEGQLVPFKGAPEALTETMTGRIDMYFAPITPALPLIRAGKVLALAVSSSKRASALPDVPTTIEAGVPDSDMDFWVGAFVPKKTPRDLVVRMQAEIAKAINEPVTKGKLTNARGRADDHGAGRVRCPHRQGSRHRREARQGGEDRAAVDGRAQDQVPPRRISPACCSADFPLNCREQGARMAKIGFIGLGNMGLPMAQNLLKAGHAVQGFDMSQAQVLALTASGGQAAASVKAAASGVEIVITMLPAGQHVREVYLGSDGVLAAAGAGTLLIDSSTIDVATARDVAAAADRRGPGHARRAGVRRRRRRAGRHAHLHGRRRRRSLRPRQAHPRDDGQDHRARRRRRQRPGGENLQQHDPRRVDDRGVGGVRAGGEARPRRAEAATTSRRSRRGNAGR